MRCFLRRSNNTAPESCWVKQESNFSAFAFRLDLDDARTQLSLARSELNETQEELELKRCQLRSSDKQLRDTEKRLSQLSQNR